MGGREKRREEREREKTDGSVCSLYVYIMYVCGGVGGGGGEKRRRERERLTSGIVQCVDQRSISIVDQHVH